MTGRCRVALAKGYELDFNDVQNTRIPLLRAHVLARRTDDQAKRIQDVLKRYPTILTGKSFLHISNRAAWGNDGASFRFVAHALHTRQVPIGEGKSVNVPDIERFDATVYLQHDVEGTLAYVLGGAKDFAFAKSRLTPHFWPGHARLLKQITMNPTELGVIFNDDVLDRSRVRLYGFPRHTTNTEVQCWGENALSDPATRGPDVPRGEVSVADFPSRRLTPPTAKDDDELVYVDIGGTASKGGRAGTIASNKADLAQLHDYVQSFVLPTLRSLRGGHLFPSTSPDD